MSKTAQAGATAACKKDEPVLPEIRCKRCNRLLFKGSVIGVEVKCPKCRCIQCFGCTDGKAAQKIQ
ncbi:phage FluMu protein Com [Desulfurispira natronophila]|uniref:Phage FluMu protein Com n=1 Tax=Desulfurispira natronophila TaxID=682562 RepID=A0A7W8DGR6_9BACT|nr:phage FluMu protein Com [Desulfurispira natronophila]